MNGFVDIHAHLLPGIDDGPEDLDGALQMARAAAQAGTATVAATPHLRADFPRVHVRELADRCHTLRDAIDREEIALRIVSGGEISLVWALAASDQELSLASYDQRGSDLLIETPHEVTPIERLLYELRVRGYRITLAHPERSHTFQRDPQRLESLTQQGVLLQINADALLAPRRTGVHRLAEHLCRRGLAHVIASDGHRAVSRRPVGALASGVEVAASIVGTARASWMASAVPEAIIGGRPLPEPPGIEPDRHRRQAAGGRRRGRWRSWVSG